MSDIDWSKAPEGTTHYFDCSTAHPWRKFSADGDFWHDGQQWRPLVVRDDPHSYVLCPIGAIPTSEPDWSKAPEGATHYNPDCVYPWLRDGSPVAYFADNRGWRDYTNPAHAKRALDGAVPRPKLPDAVIVFDQKDHDAVATVEFAQAMVRRLGQCRDAGKSGWDDPEQCPIARLAEGAVRSLRDGKLIDAANYLMMFWKRSTGYAPGVIPDYIKRAHDRVYAAPLSVEWDGTGLPPVGTVCDWAGVEVQMVAEHLGMAVVYLGNGHYGKVDPCLLSPILTPEQRAAKERDEAVAAMLDSSELNARDIVTAKQVCEALHAAGYRKTEGE